MIKSYSALKRDLFFGKIDIIRRCSSWKKTYSTGPWSNSTSQYIAKLRIKFVRSIRPNKAITVRVINQDSNGYNSSDMMPPWWLVKFSDSRCQHGGYLHLYVPLKKEKDSVHASTVNCDGVIWAAMKIRIAYVLLYARCTTSA